MKKLMVFAILFIAIGAMAAMAASNHSPPAAASTSLLNSMSITTTASSQIPPTTVSAAAALMGSPQVDLENPYAYALNRSVNRSPDIEHWANRTSLPPSTSTSSWQKTSGFAYPSPRASPTALHEKKFYIDERTTTATRDPTLKI